MSAFKWNGAAYNRSVLHLEQSEKLDTVFENLTGKVRWLEFRQKSPDMSHERGAHERREMDNRNYCGRIVFPQIYMLKP